MWMNAFRGELMTVAQTLHVRTLQEVTNVPVWAGSQVTVRPVQVRHDINLPWTKYETFTQEIFAFL